ncbi:zinc finger CCHC domain-containing protein 8 [Pararge aegeria]|uniref:Jg1779 protein n=2 Tax=Pararge aegeria TaxID=116150 RepID=A0A8S4RSY1_9NEOP|nr:zinc finger CCHC domain-containing protein 8 [Pararge aegeria]CAH2240219.1 jg1779 [Pararge aegeria aegeria]
MAKRKAGVNDIIYELDNDDIELSSADEGKETKMGRFENDIRRKQRRNAHSKQEDEAKKCTEVINLDCSRDGSCDSFSLNNSDNGGKATLTDISNKNYCKSETNCDDPQTNDEDLHNNTMFHDHNIVVDSPSNSDLGVVGCENRTPLVTVRFKDRKLAHTYKKRIKEFLINLLKSWSIDSVNLSGDSDVELDIWPEELFEEEFDKTGEIDEDFSKDDLVEEFDNVSEVDDSMFFVDTAPGDEAHTDIPKYSQTSSLITNIVEEDTSSPTTFRRGPICFNCDGEHSLKDCQLPRNHSKIAASRKNMTPRIGRYHVEDEQKYGHLVPGRISGNLRHALGLKRYELPLHIYRMRMLGYPPGWLEEARISHSGITLFDSTGNATQDPEDEDGEICEPGCKDKFDIKKILDFPGYNVPASSRYIEEAHLFGFPPMSEQDSKMEMLQALAPNAMKAYKRKKLTFFPSTNQNSFLEGQAEMELDSGDEMAEFPSMPPLPDEAPPTLLLPPPPPPTPPPEEIPSPRKVDKSDTSDIPEIKSGDSKTTGKSGINRNLDEVKGTKHMTNEMTDTKQHLTNKKKDFVDNEVDLASSSDDELQVIEVVQVTDIPVPEDVLISIDDDDDVVVVEKSKVTSGPTSPSLAALEEKKKRLLDALTGNDDVSMELIVLDETLSDSEHDTDNVNKEKLQTNDQTEIEDNISKIDKEESNTINRIKELEESLTVMVDGENLPTNKDLKLLEAETRQVESSSILSGETNDAIVEKSLDENEVTGSKDENSSTINKEVIRAESTSMSNENVKSGEDEKPSTLNVQTKPDTDRDNNHDEKEFSKSMEVNASDSKTGHVKNTSYGTPVLNIVSPFVKLPSDDKFAKDICDVLNFENLPNSTGKFKQISSLLKRVKSAVDRIQDS